MTIKKKTIQKALKATRKAVHLDAKVLRELAESGMTISEFTRRYL